MALLYFIPLLSNPNSDPLYFPNPDPLTTDESVHDHFDRLPDPVILLILNRVHDVKSLDNCYIVSHRFMSLIPLVDQVHAKIERVITVQSADEIPMVTNQIPPRGGGIFPDLSCAFQAISRLAPFRNRTASISHSGPSKSMLPDRTPFVVLRKYKEVKFLKIELPGIECCLKVGDGVHRYLVQNELLKWKAGFGSTLENCVIFCASRVYENSSSPNPSPNPNPNSEGTISNEDLQLLVKLIKSSLTAASARHYFLHNIVNDHETLERLIFTDRDEQGVLIMDDKRLTRFRAGPLSASFGPFRRTVVPAVSIKLWYSNYLDLPDGMKFEGATVMAIQPSDVADLLGDDWVLDAFNEPYKSAVYMLLKNKNYSLFEMDSF